MLFRLSLPTLNVFSSMSLPVENKAEIVAAELFHTDVTIGLNKTAETSRCRYTFRIRVVQAIQALMSMLLSFGIALFLVFTQPPVQEQAQARDSCVYLLISAMSCNAAAVGLQAHLLRCLYPSTQANWNHDSDQPPPLPSTSVLQIVSLRIHTIIGMLPSQTLPPNPSQAPPSTWTIPILRISVRRVRPFIRLRALAFGSLAAQVAGVVLLTAALAYSESQHVSHTASVVGLCGMGVIALLQTLCLFLAYRVCRRSVSGSLPERRV